MEGQQCVQRHWLVRKLGRHTQRCMLFGMARPQGLMGVVEEEWRDMKLDISNGSVVLIPSPSLQVVHWMRRRMNKITGTLVLIIY